jgi:hypothetical protein
VWGVKDSGGEEGYAEAVLGAGKGVHLGTEDDLWRRLGTGAQGAIYLLPLVNLLMQAIEPLNKLEKIILKRPGIITHDYCRAASYEPDDLVLAELGRFVDRIAAKLHPSAP